MNKMSTADRAKMKAITRQALEAWFHDGFMDEEQTQAIMTCDLRSFSFDEKEAIRNIREELKEQPEEEPELTPEQLQQEAEWNRLANMESVQIALQEIIDRNFAEGKAAHEAGKDTDWLQGWNSGFQSQAKFLLDCAYDWGMDLTTLKNLVIAEIRRLESAPIIHDMEWDRGWNSGANSAAHAVLGIVDSVILRVSQIEAAIEAEKEKEEKENNFMERVAKKNLKELYGQEALEAVEWMVEDGLDTIEGEEGASWMLTADTDVLEAWGYISNPEEEETFKEKLKVALETGSSEDPVIQEIITEAKNDVQEKISILTDGMGEGTFYDLNGFPDFAREIAGEDASEEAALDAYHILVDAADEILIEKGFQI